MMNHSNKDAADRLSSHRSAASLFEKNFLMSLVIISAKPAAQYIPITVGRPS